MPIDPKSFDAENLADYVEKALEALKDDLTDKDWGIVGSIRKLAQYRDETKHAVEALQLGGEAEPRDVVRALELYNKATYTIPQIIAGLDKLGGSVAARKALGGKPAEPKRSGLAVVRGLRGDNNEAQGESGQKATGRSRKSGGQAS